jgi:CheY-like chemotaxis protein/HPt (histidine-containing phosphotransfer) domain-containing protein
VNDFVRGDGHRVRQILNNFLNNALKFTETGEIVITLEPAPPPADGSAHVPAWRLVVSDTGIGIAPQAQERLFQRFMQADNTTTRTYGGTGLGLVICRELAERMGGQVGLDSTPGQGSRFWLTLPQRDCPAPAGTQLPQLQAPAGLRALVGLRHASSRQALAELLASAGMQVVEAAGDAELDACLAAAPESFNLVFIDSLLPASGTAARLQDLRRRCGAQARLVTLVPLTAGGDAALDERDADGVLLRPVTRSAVAVLLDRLLRPRRRRRGAAADATAAAPAQALRFDARVLLVEDTPLNREIATALLQGLGCTVTTAENGLQAVDRVATQAFDLVLMDCQMPEMDGYEASRVIRRREAEAQAGARTGEATAPLTIVALTANALAGDREACLAAGMSDYLAKPVTAARLAEALARHLPPRAEAGTEPDTAITTAATIDPTAAPKPPSPAAPVVTAAAPEPTPTPAATDGVQPPLFDAQVLATLPMVADGSDPGFMTHVLSAFLKDSTDTLQRWAQALEEGDAKAALRGIHTLKSTSAQVGALALASLAAEGEARLRRAQALEDGWRQRLLDAHAHTLGAIRAHLAPRSAGAGPATSP